LLFGENLRKYREFNELTQSELGAQIGMTQKDISKYEKKINQPNLETLKKLSNVLNCSVDDLLDNSKTTEIQDEYHKKNIVALEEIMLRLKHFISYYKKTISA